MWVGVGECVSASSMLSLKDYERQPGRTARACALVVQFSLAVVLAATRLSIYCMYTTAEFCRQVGAEGSRDAGPVYG